jgi:hypothetical protein
MRHIPELLDDTDQLTSAPAVPDKDLFGDIPSGIWIAFLACWALVFALFLLFFAIDGPAALAVVTSCFFATMILGLPAMLAAQSKSAHRPWPKLVHTQSGPLPVRAAATQILLIPVGAVIGLIGFIILVL